LGGGGGVGGSMEGGGGWCGVGGWVSGSVVNTSDNHLFLPLLIAPQIAGESNNSHSKKKKKEATWWVHAHSFPISRKGGRTRSVEKGETHLTLLAFLRGPRGGRWTRRIKD